MLTHPLHHAYLFEAPPTDGASAVSEQLRKLFAQTDTELILDTDVVDTFTIELARQLRSRGQQKATGQARCLIRGFDTITTDAQNALLKITEAPGDGTHFFFITPDSSSLLETVRSRLWRLSAADIEFTDQSSVAADLTNDFITATSLPERLQIVESIDTKHLLRQFTGQLAKTELARKNIDFGKALEAVADYVRDSGASLKLLGQLLAVAANQSPTEK